MQKLNNNGGNNEGIIERSPPTSATNYLNSVSPVEPSTNNKNKYVMPLPPGKPKEAQKSMNEVKRLIRKEKNINTATVTANLLAEQHHRQNAKKPPKTYGPYGAPIIAKVGLVGAAEEWTRWYSSEKPGSVSSRPSTSNITPSSAVIRPLTGTTAVSSNSRPASRMIDVYGRPLSADVITDMYGRPLSTATSFRPTTTESTYRPMTSDVYEIYGGRPMTSDTYIGGRPNTSDTYVGGKISRPTTSDTYTVNRPNSTPLNNIGGGGIIAENEEEEDEKEEEIVDGSNMTNIDFNTHNQPAIIYHVKEEKRPYTAETIQKLNDPSRPVYENFDPSLKPPITPYPKRPLTKEEEKNRPKTSANMSLTKKMNADDPWLIDIRGTIPYPKQAAKQKAPSTPNKRAPMTRPKTTKLGKIPLQKKVPIKGAKPDKNKIDVQELLKQAAKKRPYTVSHDSRAGHAITYKESAVELGSHQTARKNIVVQAELQVEQSIRDFETWEKDLVDLKWAKDKVKGWGTLGTDIMKNKIQRLNSGSQKNQKDSDNMTETELFRRAFHKSMGNNGEVEMLWMNINKIPKSFVTTLGFQIAGLRVMRLTGNNISTLDTWFTRSFPHLVELHLGSNKLTALPDNIGKLTSLQELYLPHNYLTELPWDIGRLTRLEIIDLTNNKLNELPNSIGKLYQLEEIYLKQNNLMRLPDTVSDLKALMQLHLGFNPIATLALMHLPRKMPPPPTADELRLWEPILIGSGENEECIGYRHVDTDEVIARLPEIPSAAENDAMLTPYQRLVRERKTVWEIQFDSRNGKSFYYNNLSRRKSARMPKSLDNFILHNLIFISLENLLLRDVPETLGECHLLEEIWLQNNKIELMPWSFCKLTKLHTLIMSNNYVHHLPKYINRMTALTCLKIDRNRIKEIPECFGQLTNLRRVWLQANTIDELPYTMMYLTSLTDLMLGGNAVDDKLRWLFEKGGIPAYQYHLKEEELRKKYKGRPPNVEIASRGMFDEVKIPKPRFDEETKEVANLAAQSGRLDLQWRSLSTIPDEFLHLTSLTELRLNNNNFTEIPDHVKHIATLVTLHVANNHLTEINEAVCGLKNLRNLFCEDNEIKELPDKFVHMFRLKKLRICRNKISHLPERIGKCVGLEVLELELNRLVKLPQSITLCKNLKRLTLQYNNIRRLPVGFDQLVSLQHLDMCRNKLKKIPLDFSRMPSLRNLYLSSNRISHIDESFGQGSLRSSLEKLWLQANRLVELPLSFQYLTTLKQLMLGWNKKLISPPFELAIDVTGELNPDVNKKIQMCDWWWTDERIQKLKKKPLIPRFKKGESGWSKYHEGTISTVNTNGTYDVVFDDTSRARCVPKNCLIFLSHGVKPRKAFQADNKDSCDVEVASGNGGKRAGRFDGEVHQEELERIIIKPPPGDGIFVGDRIRAKKPKFFAPVGFGTDSVREYCAVREWRLNDFRKAMKNRNIKFAHSRLKPKANNLLIDPLILSYLDPNDVSNIDSMADGYVNGPFPAGSNSADVVQGIIDLILLRAQQFHYRVLSALLSSVDKRRVERCEMPWGADGALMKCYVIRATDFIDLKPEEYIAEFTSPGSVGIKFKPIPGQDFGVLVHKTSGQAAEYDDGKIQEDHLLLKIGRGKNVSGEQLWADASTMTKIQIEKMVGRMKRPAKLIFRATLSMPYSMQQLLLAVSDYQGPYGKVAEKLNVWRRPFDPGVGVKVKKSDDGKEEEQQQLPPSSDSDNDDEADNNEDTSRQKRKKKRKKKRTTKKKGNKRTNDWIVIQEVIYSPKEARRLSKEYKYVKASLERVQNDVEIYLKSVAGKIKLLNEVHNRIAKLEESQSKVEEDFLRIFKSFQKTESKYEDIKGRVNHFENGANYNLHKFRSKEEAYKRLNTLREKYEKEKIEYENIEKAKNISQEQASWDRKEWTKRTKIDLFNKYKIQKAKALQLRYRVVAEKEGKRRPWDDGYEIWKEKRRLKAQRKEYEEKIARLEAKRKGIAYVSLDSSDDDESEWSVEEETEAKGELDFLKKKAQAALFSRFKGLIDIVAVGVKKIKDTIKNKYNALNAYSWDPFDPTIHCQGEWDGKLDVDRMDDNKKKT